MIGFLKGKIMEHDGGRLLLAVGGAEGAVGYTLTVPDSPAYGAFVPGKLAEFYVHTHVREDALDLYGFATRAEKELFLTLLSVNGIGPKGASSILSKVEPSQLIEAVLSGDKESLVRIPGVGKKTAERVVLELAEPLRKKSEAGAFHSLAASLPRSSGASSARGASDSAAVKDAKEALIGLGYREQDIVPILHRLSAEQGAPGSAEHLIRGALQRLSV